MENKYSYVKGCIVNNEVLKPGDLVAPKWAAHFARKNGTAPRETAIIKRIQKITIPVQSEPDRPVVEYRLLLTNCKYRDGRPSALNGQMGDYAYNWSKVGEKRSIHSIIENM